MGCSELKITGVSITPGVGSSDIEINGILLEEVPSTDGNILLYQEPSSDTFFYISRSGIYRSATAKDIRTISAEDVQKLYPDAQLRFRNA